MRVVAGFGLVRISIQNQHALDNYGNPSSLVRELETRDVYRAMLLPGSAPSVLSSKPCSFDLHLF